VVATAVLGHAQSGHLRPTVLQVLGAPLFPAEPRDAHVCVVTRLRLEANLFAFPPPKRKGRGRPANKGKRLRKLTAVLKDRKIRWQRCRITLWYGRTNRLVEITSETVLWHRAGVPPVPIRWLLVRDPKGEFDPQAFLATDLDARPQDILAWFVRRWQIEVTFEDLPYCTPSYVIEKTESVDWNYTYAELLRDGTLPGTWQRRPSTAPTEHSLRLGLPADAFDGSCGEPSYL
jgi:hypothetical protein